MHDSIVMKEPRTLWIHNWVSYLEEQHHFSHRLQHYVGIQHNDDNISWKTFTFRNFLVQFMELCSDMASTYIQKI